MKMTTATCRTAISILAFYAVSLGPVGCGRKDLEIVGKWSSHSQYQYGKEQLEFFSDRTCYVESEGSRLAGTWTALDDGRLRVTFAGFGGQSSMIFASVDGDELTLDAGGGQRSAYAREGSAFEAKIKSGIQQAVVERDIRIEAEKRDLAERREAEERAERARIEAGRLARAKREEEKRLAYQREQEGERALNAASASLKRGLYSEAVSELEKSISFGNLLALNELAWHFAVCADPRQHNGKRAIELALSATQREPENAGYSDTLAAAYARDNQFDKAVSTQVRALSLGHVSGGEERLKLYREGAPYQQENPDDIANRFMSLLLARKHNEAELMLTEEMQNRPLGFGSISDMTLKDQYRSDAFKSYTITANSRDDGWIQYNVVAVTFDGMSHHGYLNLKRIGLNWKIDHF